MSRFSHSFLVHSKTCTRFHVLFLHLCPFLCYIFIVFFVQFFFSRNIFIWANQKIKTTQREKNVAQNQVKIEHNFGTYFGFFLLLFACVNITITFPFIKLASFCARETSPFDIQNQSLICLHFMLLVHKCFAFNSNLCVRINCLLHKSILNCQFNDTIPSQLTCSI